jgi:hypothetical protein
MTPPGKRFHVTRDGLQRPSRAGVGDDAQALIGANLSSSLEPSSSSREKSSAAQHFVIELLSMRENERAARELLELLSHHIAAPKPAAVRETRLGLLIDLLLRGEDGLPTEAHYERLREESDGDWPSAQAIADAYLGWDRALSCALAVIDDQPRVHSQLKHLRPTASYTREETLSALLDCHYYFGWIPEQWDYEAWASLERKRLRALGVPARVPGLTPIRKEFASFDAAKKALSRRLRELSSRHR